MNFPNYVKSAILRGELERKAYEDFFAPLLNKDLDELGELMNRDALEAAASWENLIRKELSFPGIDKKSASYLFYFLEDLSLVDLVEMFYIEYGFDFEDGGLWEDLYSEYNRKRNQQ